MTILYFAATAIAGASFWPSGAQWRHSAVGRALARVAPAFGLGGGTPPPPGPVVTATKAASFPPGFDVDGDGKADPGDKIRYTVTIADATADATGVHLADTPDPNTTLVGGSIVISPLAINETYESVGNMTLTSAAIGANCGANPLHSVTCNDVLNGGTLTGFGATQGTANGMAPGGTLPTTLGGSVVLNADGTFVYNPPAGFQGADIFWYTLTSPGGVAGTDTASVTINVGTFPAVTPTHTNGMVWFITPAGAGTGRQLNPISLDGFRPLNDGAASHPAAGDTIFLFEGAHPLTATLTLLGAQKVIGQDTTATLANLGAPAPQPGNTYPAVNNPTGTDVSITSTAAALTLGSGNTLAGFTAGNATTAITGGAVGTLNVREVTINTNGQGLTITASGTFTSDATYTGFTSVSSSGGANGILLTSAAGMVNLGSGTLSGNTGAAFSVNGGAAALNYSGTIQNSTGRQVNIASKTGGTVALSGAVGGTGTGVFLNSNAGAAINFTGGITLSTGGADAFTATGGGIVNVSGTNNITTTSGKGVNWSGDTSTTGVTFNNITSTTGGAVVIASSGASNFTFHDVTSTTGTAVNVNAATGAFIFHAITANGAATGVSVSNLTGGGSVTVTGTGGSGLCDATHIGGTDCQGGTIQNTTTRGVEFTTVAGVSLKNMYFKNAATTSGSTAGCKTAYSVGTSTCNAPIYFNGSTGGATLDRVFIDGSVQMGIAAQGVNGITLTNTEVQNTTSAANQAAVTLLNNTGTIAVTALNLHNNDSGGTGMLFVENGSGTMTLNVTGSTFNRGTVNSGGINAAAYLTAHMTVNIQTSTFGDVVAGNGLYSNGVTAAGNDDSTFNCTINGSSFRNTNGISTGAAGTGSVNVTYAITNNNPIQNKVNGSNGLTFGKSGGSGSVTSTVTGNTIIGPSCGGGCAGMRMNAFGAGGTSNATITGNVISGVQGDGILFAAGQGATSSTVTIQSNSFTAAAGNDGFAINAVTGTQTGDNPTATLTLGGAGGLANPVSGTWFSISGPPNYRINLDETLGQIHVNGYVSGGVENYISGNNPTVPAAQVLIQGTIGGEPVPAAMSHSVTALAAAPAQALDGPEPTREPHLLPANGPYLVATLMALSTRVPQPRTTAPGFDVIAVVGNAATRVERAVLSLLNAIRNDLSASVHAAGLPAPPASPPPVDVDVTPTLPVGKTIRVVFDVTVNAPPVASYSNQATVSSTAASFSDVLTNTATTTGDRFNTTTALVSSLNPSFQGDAITFTATVTPTEGTGLTPDGTVQFKDGATSVGAAATCVQDTTAHTCTAQLTTTTLGTGSRSITAIYSGGTNHDPSTSTILTQVNNACTANPVVTTNADTNAGSLRDAIAIACPGNTITFSGVVSPIGLTSGELLLTKNVILTGPGANLLTVQRTGGTSRIFHLSSGKTATISGLTIAGGNTTTGAGIWNDHGALTITNSTISGNGTTSTAGGGILNDGSTTAASLTIVHSTLSSNTSFNGGALYNQAISGGTATATITNTTISGNTATDGGAGLLNFGSTPTNGVLTVTNSTITNNHANNDNSGAETGGGLWAITTTATTLRNTIVARNYTGSGTTTADDISGTIDSGSASNLIGVNTNLSGVTDGSNGNHVGTAGSPIDPRLGPLANNGGPTFTHALLAGSPALDAGDNTFVVAPPFLNTSPITDQRGTGFARTRDAADADLTATVDIGALEADPMVEAITDKATTEDTPLSFAFNIGDTTIPFGTITASSSNTTLVPNLNANLNVTGSGATRTLNISPALNQFGTTTITVTAPKTVGGTPLTATDTFVLTVSPVGDTPSVTNATTVANVQTTSGLVVSRHAADGAEIGFFKITNIANGALFQHDGTTPIANTDFITFAQGNAGLRFTPTSGGTATGSFQVQSSVDGVGTGLSAGFATATITVNTHATTTTIVSDNPDPSDRLVPVTVVYTVVSNDGGPTPTGNVVVTISGGGETCTGTVGDGQCQVTLTVAGVNRTITASYGGDAVNAISANTALHTVNPCPAAPVVTTTADGGAGSLRQAIADACATDTITVNLGTGPHTIDLTTATLQLNKNLTITGPGADLLTVQRAAAGPFRVFTVNAGVTVAISGLTIANGVAEAFDDRGGGIFSNGSSLTVASVHLTGNAAQFGGGIYSSGEIALPASLTVVNSTLSGNQAESGGGIYSQSAVGGTATLTMTHSTVSGNLATAFGGGLRTGGGVSSPVTITNSTFTGNRADSDTNGDGTGGGISNAPAGGPVLLRNTIVAGNVVGGSPSTTADDLNGTFDAASANNLIGADTGMLGIAGNGNQIGTAGSPIDPRLGPLGGNGGPTPTHALRPGSPALDAGDNALVAGATDQRGPGFGRIRDAADVDTTATVDIGAFEADPSLEAITDKTIPEDTPLSFTFHVGDSTSAFTSITATSSNTTLVPPANAVVGADTPSTRTLTLTPALNQFGTTTITVTATKTIGGTPVSMSDTFLLTVTPVADTPGVTGATTNEDTQTTSGLVISRNAADGAEVTHVKITGITNGTLFQTDGTTPIANNAFITVAQGNAGLKFTPSANLFSPGTPFSVTVQASLSAGDAGLGGSPVTATITVNTMADTPSVTGATTNEDTQTTSGLVIGRNAADGTEVTHFKITGITNGTLFQTDGTTPIANNDFITFAEGNAGLKFTPAADFFGTGSFTAQASLSNVDAGLGGGTATATITVNPIADTPSVTNATTLANVQSSSGLVITRNAADGGEVTVFKITTITNGLLFQNDGTTPIANGAFIPVAAGGLGLRFTPAPGQSAPGSFDVQGALDAGGAGLSPAATATITVTRHHTGTTIVSDNPDPSDRLAPVTVVYTVVSTEDGGPTPTGDVTVTIGGGPETCTGTVAEGQCALTPTVPGVNRTITASYGGDGISDLSANTTLHTVSNCPATPEVTTAADAGPGSLRQAILDACTTDTITFNIPGPGPDTISLTTGELSLDKNLTITGPTAKGVTISGANTSRVFNVAPGATVALSNLTIANGQAGFGAGIFSLGNLTISHSTVTGNQAVGGEGGGIDAEGGTLTILNSTISGNRADTDGGGLLNCGTTTALLVNVTITNNQADADGDGVGVGGGIAQISSNTLTLRNTIVAGNSATSGTPDDVNVRAGSVLDPASHHNLIGVDPGVTGIVGGTNGNLIGTSDVPLDPRLDLLADNGGPTFTHAMLAGSPALDAGDNAAAAAAGLTTDQRGPGFARVRDAADANTTQTVDIGAVEADPVVEAIPDQSTPEDTPLSFSFNVGDAGTAFDAITATSNNTTLVPDANLSLTGSGSTRTLTITPAADLNGTMTITVTVTKTIGGTVLSMTDTFVLTVTPVNDPPTLNIIPNPPAILEDAAQQTVSLSGITAGGGESQMLTVTASSDNTALIPNPTVSYTSPNTTGSIGYTPVANANGSAIITVTVIDNGGGTNSISRSFTVTVTPVNDPPTLNAIPDPPAILEDAPQQTVNLSGISAGPGESQTLTVTASSNNTALIPNPAVTYTSPNATGSLSYTPVANANGFAVITVTVDDGGPGTHTVTRTFTVNVTPVNDLPTIADITDRQLPANTSLQIPVTVGDIETAPSALVVTASSSNQTVVPNAGLVVSPGGASRTLTLTPAANQSGTATITVTVDDGTGGQASDTFVVTVLPALSIADASMAEGNSGTTNLAFTVSLAGPSASTVSAHYATRQRTAIAHVDYIPVAGTVSFAPGATTATILVPIVGDLQSEIDETFYVDLSGALNGVITGAQAVGTIVNDDPTSPFSAELVTWGRRTGVIADGGSLTKTAGLGWTAAASSTKVLKPTDGSVEFSVGTPNQRAVVGLSRTLTPFLVVTDIEFGIQLLEDTTFAVVEHGVNVTGPLGVYAPGDRFEIVPAGGTVFYLLNGSTRYVSTATPVFPLRVDAAIFTPGATIAEAVLGGRLGRLAGATGDFDNDGKADPTVFRPSTGFWHTLKSSTNYTTSQSVSWGLSTDVPVAGDYDGDGKVDPAIYRPSTGLWAILKSSTNFTTSMTVSWGVSTDLPVPADFDGDGRIDPAIYRPSTGTWYILKSTTNYNSSIGVSWGLSTDVPMPGDYDGDGQADPAIFRPSTGLWAILKSSTNYAASTTVSWGLSTDVAVPGDYDGDGKTDPAVFRPSTGGWYLLQSSTNYTTSVGVSWGLSTDIPVPADYDGDGKYDPAIYRPSTGLWAILKSSTSYTSSFIVSWGLSTDVPVNKRP